MKSWSQWFADTVADRKKEARKPAYPVGLVITDDGEIPLNTAEGRRLYNEYLSIRNGRL